MCAGLNGGFHCFPNVMVKSDLDLRMLYYGHDQTELSVLCGALESADIPFIQKRAFGFISHAPAVFFSPGTEVRIYVSERDWVRAVELAQTVLGEDWEEPPPEI